MVGTGVVEEALLLVVAGYLVVVGVSGLAVCCVYPLSLVYVGSYC